MSAFVFNVLKCSSIIVCVCKVVRRDMPETPQKYRTFKSLKVMFVMVSPSPSIWFFHDSSPVPRLKPPILKSVSSNTYLYKSRATNVLRRLCFYTHIILQMLWIVNIQTPVFCMDFCFNVFFLSIIFCLSEFEVNIVIVLHDDHLITENFPLKLVRV